MSFLNAWAVLWLMYMIFSIVVNLIGGAMIGQLYLIRSMVLTDFAGTLVVSFITELIVYMSPERRNNGRTE